MGIRIAFTCAAVSIGGVATWLSPFSRSVPDVVPAVPPTSAVAFAQERTEGSALPCAVPLAWRIARVDEEFGISRDQARAAVQEAAWVWERAAGQPLFRHDSIDGFPIRIVYDGRQERARDRRRREMALDSAVQRLTLDRDELTLRSEQFALEKTRLDARVRNLDRRVSEHNAMVRRLNRQGGAPEDRAREIQAAGEALELQREELEEETRRLEREVRALDDDRDRLDRRIRRHSRRAEEFAEAFPPTTSEWGVYREAIHGGGGEIVSVSREIRIYRFEDDADLVAVATHELGHALGLDHNAATGAVMSGERVRTGPTLGPTELDPTDVEAFAAVCPDLVSDGQRKP